MARMRTSRTARECRKAGALARAQLTLSAAKDVPTAQRTIGEARVRGARAASACGGQSTQVRMRSGDLHAGGRDRLGEM